MLTNAIDTVPALQYCITKYGQEKLKSYSSIFPSTEFLLKFLSDMSPVYIFLPVFFTGTDC